MAETMKLSSTKDVRHMLLNSMSSVAHGDMDPKNAKAICNLAQQVYNTVNLEIKFAVAKNALPEGAKISSIDLR